MAYWPGMIEAGKVSDALVDMTDLLPTLAEIVGTAKPGFPLDGKSFAGLLRAEEYAGREWVCTQTRSKTAVRTREWKLLSDGNLYDVREAPFEEILVEQGREPKGVREKLEGWIWEAGGGAHLNRKR